MLRTGILRLRVGDTPLACILQGFAHKIFPPSNQEQKFLIPLHQRIIVPPSHIDMWRIASGGYEREVTALCLNLIKPGMNVVDAGANLGYYTLITSALIKHGEVHAFEPQPFLYSYLCRNVVLNGCHNVVVNQTAIADNDGTAVLYGDPKGGASSLFQHPRGVQQIEVPTISLDSYFSNAGWPRVDFIKMDIEGAEVRALSGMRELVRRNPQVKLTVEFGSWAHDELLRAILDCGFNRISVIEREMKEITDQKGYEIIRRWAQEQPLNLLCEQIE